MKSAVKRFCKSFLLKQKQKRLASILSRGVLQDDEFILKVEFISRRIHLMPH
jgi:hypothetical protein